MAVMTELEKVKHERDDLKARLDQWKPRMAELQAENKDLGERLATFEQKLPSIAEEVRTLTRQNVERERELVILRKSNTEESEARAEAVKQIVMAEKRSQAALARDNESFAALQGVQRVVGAIVNRRLGITEVNEAGASAAG